MHRQRTVFVVRVGNFVVEASSSRLPGIKKHANRFMCSDQNP